MFLPKQGVTLLEIIIVMAIMVTGFTLLAPSFGMQTQAKVDAALSKITTDVRGIFDRSVMSGKVHRMVINMHSGEYHFETTDEKNPQIVSMTTTETDHGVFTKIDPKLSWKDQVIAFDEIFKKYEGILGDPIKDSNSDTSLPQPSPVIQARDKLKPSKWDLLDGVEWTGRELPQMLAFFKIVIGPEPKSEFKVTDTAPEDLTFIYFYPSGYMDPAYIQLYFKKSDTEIDDTKKPYTLLFRSRKGELSILSGALDIDVSEGGTDEYQEPQ